LRILCIRKSSLHDLAPEITNVAPSPNHPNSVILTFEDKAKAIDWEQEMILWKLDVEEDDIRAKSQLSLVTVWNVDDFQKRLGLSKHDSDDEQGTVFAVDVVQTQRPVDRPHFSDQRRASYMTDLGIPSKLRGTDGSYLYKFFKVVLGTRFGKVKTINKDSSLRWDM
jgi:hypothetical protein